MFINEKCKLSAELSDQKCHWDLALLCDIIHHVNDLNTKFKDTQELIFDIFGTVRAFSF